MISTQFIILMTFNLFYQIEGIRSFLSFMIFSWALFKDLNSKSKSSKVISFAMYILSILIHPITLVFVLFRLIIFLRRKFIFINNKLFYFIFLIFYSHFNNMLIIILNHFDSVPFIDSVLLKLQSYVYGQSNFQTFSNRSEILFTSVVFLVLIFELLLFFYFNGKGILPKEYLNIYLYIVSFTIGSFLSVQIYLRTVMLILFLSAPIKMMLLDKKGIKDNAVYIDLMYQMVIYMVAIFGFVLWYMLFYKNVLIF